MGTGLIPLNIELQQNDRTVCYNHKIVHKALQATHLSYFLILVTTKFNIIFFCDVIFCETYNKSKKIIQNIFPFCWRNQD